MSTIRTRVFEAQFLHRSRASKARDVILLNSFQFLLTNYKVWQTHATLQITYDEKPPALGSRFCLRSCPLHPATHPNQFLVTKNLSGYII